MPKIGLPAIRFFSLALLFAGSLTLFLLLIQKQSEYGDANARRNALVLDGRSLELKSWQLTFRTCKDNRCTDVNETPIDIELPDPSRTQSLLRDQFQHASIARLFHKFSNKELEWLGAYGETFLTFTVPSNSQTQTMVKAGTLRTRSVNSGNHILLSVKASELFRAGEVELLYAIDDLDWFGPADLPPAFLSFGSSSEYLALRERQIASANLYRQLYIGLPFLIAAIALVLDHSMAFTLLALYGVSQALKSFLYYGLDNGFFQFQSVATPIYASTGLGFALVILLAFELARIQLLSIPSKFAFALASSVAVVLTKIYGPGYVLTSDALIDTLASAGGALICLFGLGQIMRHQVQNSNPTKHLAAGQHLEPPSKLVTFRLLIAGFGFVIHGWANANDLALLEKASFKDFLDWKHNILYAALMTAALLEVGSTSRKMVSFAKGMVHKALLERELAVGREVQQRMLPPKRGSEGPWAWRSVYIPASALAGDWFDIRKIEFPCGKSAMVACLADVTGHGVGAALATSVISSHWTLWCQKITQNDQSEDLDAFAKLLTQAPGEINKGLLALRNNENCTAIFAALLDGVPEIFIVCAGHPGAIVTSGRDVRYVTSRGPRLGVEAGELEWTCERAEFGTKDVALLYSDGIVPPGKTISSWIAGVKRNLRKEAQGTLFTAVSSQVLANRRLFRKDREIEDDMTVLGIGHSHPKKADQEDTHKQAS